MLPITSSIFNTKKQREQNPLLGMFNSLVIPVLIVLSIRYIIRQVRSAINVFHMPPSFEEHPSPFQKFSLYK